MTTPPPFRRRRSAAYFRTLAVASAACVSVLAASTAANAAWTTPAAFTTPDAGMNQAFDVGVSSTGVGMMMWSDSETGNLMFATSTTPGGPWGAAARVFVPVAGVSYFEPSIAALAGGGFMAIWRAQGASSGAIQTATFDETAGWGTPEEITLGTDIDVGGEATPEIAVNSAGVAFATWDGTAGVQVARRPALGPWDEAERAVPADGPSLRGDGPQVAVDDEGNATVVWDPAAAPWDDGKVSIPFVRFDADPGEWSPVAPVATANSGRRADRPKIGVDDAGRVSVAWREYSSDALVDADMSRAYTASLSLGAWSAPFELTTEDAQDPSTVGIAVEPGGPVTVVWEEDDGWDNVRERVVARRAVGGTWGSRQVIKDNPDEQTYDPTIAAYDGGVVVTWYGAGISATSFDADRGTWLPEAKLGQNIVPRVAADRTATSANGATIGFALETDAWYPRAVRMSGSGAPGAPTAVTGTAKVESIDASWSAPGNLGGWNAPTYTATTTPGGLSCTSMTTSCTIDGAEGGRPYTVTVTAANAIGESAASAASDPVTPLDSIAVGAIHPFTTGWELVAADYPLGVPMPAYNADTGTSLVVYFVHATVDGAPRKMYATQRLAADGAPLGEPVVVSDAGRSAFWYGSPTVVANPETGGWVVLYVEGPRCDVSVDSSTVKAQLVNGDGTLDGPAKPIFTGTCEVPAISANWDGENERFYVSAIIGGAGYSVQGRFMDAAANPVGDVIPINSTWSGFNTTQTAFSPVSGNYLTTIFGVSDEDTKRRPVGIWLGPDGAPTDDEMIEFVPSDVETNNASVVYVPTSDEYVVAWSSSGNNLCTSEEPGQGCGVFTQRVDAATKARVGSPVTVTPAMDDENFHRPQLAVSTLTGDVLVTWNRVLGGHSDAMARTLTPDNTFAQPEAEVVSGGAYAIRPAATFNEGACRFIGVWNSGTSDTAVLSARTLRAGICGGSNELTVVREGDGAGGVASSTGGIDCGTTCEATFTRTSDPFPDVTLTADAAAGSVFGGWSGDACSGTSSTCVVPMHKSQDVVATFQKGPAPDPAPAPGPTPAQGGGQSPAGTTPSAGGPAAATTPPVLRALPDGRTEVTFRMRFREAGRYTFILVNSKTAVAGTPGIAFRPGSRIGSRVLSTPLSAPVRSGVKAGSRLTIVAVIDGAAPKGLALRSVLRRTDGSLFASTVPAAR